MARLPAEKPGVWVVYLSAPRSHDQAAKIARDLNNRSENYDFAIKKVRGGYQIWRKPIAGYSMGRDPELP